MRVGPKLAPRPASAYQFSLRTSRPAADVLAEVSSRPLPGIGVAERGEQYVVLRPERRRRFAPETAALMGVGIALVVLALVSLTPVFIVLLPLAGLPAIPFLFEHDPDIAVSAVAIDDGSTRVTVHGLASSELAAALDAFLGSLPGAGTAPAMPRPSALPPASPTPGGAPGPAVS